MLQNGVAVGPCPRFLPIFFGRRQTHDHAVARARSASLLPGPVDLGQFLAGRFQLSLRFLALILRPRSGSRLLLCARWTVRNRTT